MAIIVVSLAVVAETERLTATCLNVPSVATSTEPLPACPARAQSIAERSVTSPDATP